MFLWAESFRGRHRPPPGRCSPAALRPGEGASHSACEHARRQRPPPALRHLDLRPQTPRQGLSPHPVGAVPASCHPGEERVGTAVPGVSGCSSWSSFSLSFCRRLCHLLPGAWVWLPNFEDKGEGLRGVPVRTWVSPHPWPGPPQPPSRSHMPGSQCFKRRGPWSWECPPATRDPPTLHGPALPALSRPPLLPEARGEPLQSVSQVQTFLGTPAWLPTWALDSAVLLVQCWASCDMGISEVQN